MSRVESHMQRVTKGFPRVSGDEPLAAFDTLTVVEFSPRERG